MNSQETTALEIVADMPVALMRKATDCATVCKEIVVRTACNIQGRKYVKCEGWMAIATAHGCMARSRDVQRCEGGWTAIGEIVRVSDGVLLSTAEGFVGKDEKKWGNCPEYASRAMVQTRAISRACRAAFAHVVVLMDAGLSTTPAEEVPDGGFDNDRPAKTATAVEVKQPATKLPPSITKTRDPMIELLLSQFEQNAIRDFAIKWGAIAPGQSLTDWREDLVPKDADDMKCLEGEIKKFTDGGEIQPVPQKSVDGYPKSSQQQNPTYEQAITEPDGPDWREVQFTFGKHKGKSLSDLDESSQKWWFKSYEVGEGRFASKNQIFRDALDAMGEELGFNL